jgi:hypothetical protein
MGDAQLSSRYRQGVHGGWFSGFYMIISPVIGVVKNGDGKRWERKGKTRGFGRRTLRSRPVIRTTIRMRKGLQNSFGRISVFSNPGTESGRGTLLPTGILMIKETRQPHSTPPGSGCFVITGPPGSHPGLFIFCPSGARKCLRSKVSGGESKAVSPLRSATALHIAL